MLGATLALALAPSGMHLPLFAAAVALRLSGAIRIRKGKRFLIGAAAEREVGRALARIASELGYTLRHDVRKRGGGDLAHLLLAPHLAVVVETKRSRFTAADIAQARRHVAYAARRYRRPAVAAVCVARDRIAPQLHEGIYVFSPRYLERWLRRLRPGDVALASPRSIAPFRRVLGLLVRPLR